MLSLGPNVRGIMLERGLEPMYEFPARYGEFGLSIDGSYLQQPAFEPGITFVIELEPEFSEYPVFYLGPYDYDLTRLNYNFILAHAKYVHETEVVCRSCIDIDKIMWAYLHVDEKKLKADRERAIEKHEGTLPGYMKEEFNATLRVIRKVRELFPIKPIPKTKTYEFMQNVKDEAYRLSYDMAGTKSKSELFRLFRKQERLLRPYHTALAELYCLDYQEVIDQAWEFISSYFERLRGKA